jgi:tRNA(Ile2) C34 agmatinyltransferase TiaS
MPNGDQGTDLERDQVGVIPDHPIICAKCQREMQHVGKNHFRCAHCGYVYKEQ